VESLAAGDPWRVGAYRLRARLESLAAGDPWRVGAYRLRARLESGGMGQVFVGYSPAGRPVAVKVIHPELANDPMFRTRFRTAGRPGARCSAG
jgi:serine/threonine protein kinase